LNQAAIRNPTEPVFDPADTDHGGYYTVVTASGYMNPVAMIRERQDDVDDRYLSGDINASYALLREFKLTLHGSYNTKQNYNGMYQTRYFPDLGMSGNAVVSTTYTNDILFEPGVEYKKAFNGHNIQAIAGYSFFENQYRELWTNNYNFDLDNFSYNNIGAGYALTDGLAEMTSARNENRLTSFYGRVIYSFLDRYLLSASVRHEGSSRFGVNNKWGTFPAISAGWRIDEEKFMRNVSWVSSLKFRVGYGVTGNQDIPNYLSLSRLSISPRQMYYNGGWINTYQPASNPNPDLKWERKEEYNAGIDFGLFDNRLSGSIDYYRRRISDLLWWYSVPVPPNVYNNMYANVGEMENRGLELQLNAELIRSRDFSVNTSVNYSRNRNKLISFSDENRGYELKFLKVNPAATTWTEFVTEGQPLGNFMAPVFTGVDANGNAIYEDVDKNGSVNVESETDRRVVGNAYPKFELGWSSSIRYKQLDLSFFVRGVFGHSLVNYERIFYENWQPLLNGRNILRTKLENNPDYKGIPTYDSRFVEKASFIKLNNVSIGYNLKVGKNNTLRIYATGQNLVSITDYTGTDPEMPIKELNTNTAVAGTENLSYYPFAKTFSLGFNFKF
jgi:TonB-linked SusC/RagA family outer membrane protein